MVSLTLKSISLQFISKTQILEFPFDYQGFSGNFAFER